MKRLIVMLIVFVLVSAPVIAGIWMLIEPEYQARAEVRVRPVIPRLVFRTDENGAIPFYESFVNTQVSMIRSLAVVQRVLDQREVQETQWYKSPRRSLFERWREEPLTLMERLKSGLTVQPRPGTEIIDVCFAGPNAKDAKLIVDTVLNEYLKYTGEATNGEDEKLYLQLVDQYKSLENEIRGREKVCATLQKSLGTESPQQLISSQRICLDETQARLSELRHRIAILEWEMKEATRRNGDDVAPVPTAGEERRPKYHEDAEWRQRDIALRTIRHDITAGELDPNDPDTIRAHKDLEFVEELLRLREAQLDEQWQDRTAARVAAGGEAPLKHQLARAQQEERLVLAAYNNERNEFEAVFGQAQLLAKETSELQHKRELFSTVRQRLDQKNMERNVPGVIDVLMWAYASPEPYNDHRLAFTGGALALGLCAAAIVRLLMHKARTHDTA